MKKVLIRIDTPLGDTIAATPYVEKFTLDRMEDIVLFEVSDNLIPLLSPVYPSINFIGRDHSEECDERVEFRYDYNNSVQSGFAKQLGHQNPIYLRPKILKPDLERTVKNKYVAIGTHSTSQIKYWNHPNGKRVQPQSPYWNELCGLLRKKGLTPVAVEQHETFGFPPFRNGVPQKSNKKIGQSLIESMGLIYHSEFYIGLSSGMSWIAHALGKKVVMISNFTEDWNEFDLSTEDYTRITNKEVCHGCWNKIGKKYTFDEKDWYWCPEHKGTERQFECHKSITPEMVINQIQHLL